MASKTPSRYFILSGAGLSAASGIPTFRDANGLWEGNRVEEVATPEAWVRNPALVRRFYDERRLACAAVSPNPGHEALARLQQVLGRDRVHLVTQNIDGLLQRAGADEVLEMHGSLWRLRCSRSLSHPRLPVTGAQGEGGCAVCGAPLRPDIVWFGEVPFSLETIGAWVQASDVFVAVGTSGVVYPAAGLVRIAKESGAKCLEINPVSTAQKTVDGGYFDAVIEEGSETALPRWVDAILARA